MANIFQQAKDILQMRKDAKRIQSEIESITKTCSNGGITITVRGDFEVKELKIGPEAIDELKAGKVERFQTMFTNLINSTIKSVKSETQARMMEQMKQDGSLSSLFGGK